MEEQAQPMAPAASGPYCKCPHHKVVPALIALIGASFLLNGLGWISGHANSIIWPIFLILIGCDRAMSYECKCTKTHKKG